MLLASNIRLVLVLFLFFGLATLPKGKILYGLVKNIVVVYLLLHHTKLYSFPNLSLAFILKIP